MQVNTQQQRLEPIRQSRDLVKGGLHVGVERCAFIALGRDRCGDVLCFCAQGLQLQQAGINTWLQAIDHRHRVNRQWDGRIGSLNHSKVLCHGLLGRDQVGCHAHHRRPDQAPCRTDGG